MPNKRLSRVLRILALSLFVAGCGVTHESAKKAAPAALITTPAAYYSSPKAKLLGAKYKDNLDVLVERIIRDSKTGTLQFANNIASVGGIGFFTHSAAKLSDERFLEVVVAAPDAFELKGDYNPKLSRLFGSYGTELLSILASDTAIYQDKDVSGYGLNFSWRSLGGGEPGRVTVERAVVYLTKDRVRAYLRRELTQNHLLADAVIFAGQESGPMTLVSYRAQNAQPDIRPPIQDETLTAAAAERRSAEPQAQEPKAALVKENNERALDASVAQPLAIAPEKKPSVSKPAAPPISEAGALAAKPAARIAAEAQAAPAVRAHPQPPKAPQPNPSPVPGAPDAKPLEGQTAGAGSKAAPGGQPNKTEAVAAVSNKPPTARSVASAATPTQKEKVPEANAQQEKALSVSKPIGNGANKAAMKTEAAEKSVQPDARRPQTQLAAKAASEELAVIQKKGAETAADGKTAAGSRTAALLGYVIQIVFENKSNAQRWAETIARRGHAVSLTETEGASFRLRLGNFVLREEAERQLRALKEEGLAGIILNLPQAYHPDAGKTATVVKPADAAPAAR